MRVYRRVAGDPMTRQLPLAGVIAGVIADRVWGDPQHWHPVAGFGRYALWLERRMYRDSRLSGVAYACAAVVPVVVAAHMTARRAPNLTMAVALWSSLGGTTLERVGLQLADALESGDDERARSWIPWLCSRDPHQLDHAGLARAGTESVAENTSDAAVVPLVLAALGAPGVVVAHRAINTLDAMVGYRNTRYGRFGWASARLDDAIAFLPARVNGIIHCLLAATRGRGRQAVRAWARQSGAHPSPNAGVVESTAAGYLGCQLGGTTVYAHGVEHRPVLGWGEAPGAAQVRDAVRLARRAQGVTVCAACLVLAIRGRVRRRG